MLIVLAPLMVVAFTIYIIRSSMGCEKACVWLQREGCGEWQQHSCFCAVGIPFSSFFMQQKFPFHSVSPFFRLACNGMRAGDRSPVLRLRQGYGACTLLGGV